MYLIFFIITYFFNYLSIMKAHSRMMISKSEEGNGGDHPTGFDFDLVNKNTKNLTQKKKKPTKKSKKPSDRSGAFIESSSSVSGY